jgi:hypothetical protein
LIINKIKTDRWHKRQLLSFAAIWAHVPSSGLEKALKGSGEHERGGGGGGRVERREGGREAALMMCVQHRSCDVLRVGQNDFCKMHTEQQDEIQPVVV